MRIARQPGLLASCCNKNLPGHDPVPGDESICQIVRRMPGLQESLVDDARQGLHLRRVKLVIENDKVRDFAVERI